MFRKRCIDREFRIGNKNFKCSLLYFKYNNEFIPTSTSYIFYFKQLLCKYRKQPLGKLNNFMCHATYSILKEKYEFISMDIF